MESKERTGEDQEKLQSTESGTIYDKTKSVSEEHSENQNDDDNEKLKSTLEIGAEHEDEMEEVLSERVKEVNYISSFKQYYHYSIIAYNIIPFQYSL